MKLQLHAAVAALSPFTQAYFFNNNCNEIKLNPLNEQRIRIWLRELYPQIFNHQQYFHPDHQHDSLQLEEIRAIFRAVIDKHIKQEWFIDNMFTEELGESLALLLRNQRDRILLDYFQRLNIDYPFGQNANMSIWRQVMNNIAYDNQKLDYDMWIFEVFEQLERDSSLTDEPSYIDVLIYHILKYFDDEPLMSFPSSTIYNTQDPLTYDTLCFDYEPRKYSMTGYLRTKKFPTRLCLLSQSMSQQLNNGIPLPNNNNSLNFNLLLTIEDAVERQRIIGPILNINALYNKHGGFLEPFLSRSKVRKAICNIIYQEFINENNDIPYLDHEEPFTDVENKCLLIALLDNTIVPSLYEGRALPLNIINDLKLYIDKNTKLHMDNALNEEQKYELPLNNTTPLFINLVESDTIMWLVTGSFPNKNSWWNSLREFLDDNNCPDQIKQIRNQYILPNKDSKTLHKINTQLISIITEIRNNGNDFNVVETIDEDELNTKYEVNFIDHLRDTHTQLSRFFLIYDQMLPQRIPHPCIRPIAYEDINQLYEKAIKDNTFTDFDEHTETFLKHQRFLFDANIHDKSRRNGISFTPSMNNVTSQNIKLFNENYHTRFQLSPNHENYDNQSTYGESFENKNTSEQNEATWGTKHSYGSLKTNNNTCLQSSSTVKKQRVSSSSSSSSSQTPPEKKNSSSSSSS